MRYGMVEVVVELPSWQEIKRYWVGRRTRNAGNMSEIRFGTVVG